MIKRVLLFFALSTSFASFAKGELEFLLNFPVEPTTMQIEKVLNAMTDADRAALLASANQALPELTPALKAFLSGAGLSLTQARELRSLFIDSTARSILQHMDADRNLRLRLLSRDMNDIYLRVMTLLAPDNEVMKLSQEGKRDLLSRIDLVNLSRPIAKQLQTSDQLQAVLRITDAELRDATKVVLLDLGYLGTIPGETMRVAAGALRKKMNWYFIWRAPNAENYIQSWSNSEFSEILNAQYPTVNDGLLSAVKQSFRTEVIEHSAKWTPRLESFNESPVVVMLDVDDTILKEVPLEFAGHSYVQSVTYAPDDKTYRRYQDRLQKREQGKVIHYRFLDNRQIESFVSVRPSFEFLLNDLQSLIEEKRVRILLTSSNDELRTNAVFQQLKVGGKTLKDWGLEVLPKKYFEPADAPGAKDMNLVLRSLNYPKNNFVLAIDNITDTIRLSKNSYAYKIDEWGLPRAVKGLSSGERLSAELEMRQVSRMIYQNLFSTTQMPEPQSRLACLNRLIQDIKMKFQPSDAPPPSALTSEEFRAQMKSRWDELQSGLPRVEQDQQDYLSSNGSVVQKAYVQSLSSLQGLDNAIKSQGGEWLSLEWIWALSRMRAQSQISGKDHRRILAQILSRAEITESFLKNISSLIQKDTTLARTLAEKREFFMTTKKPGTEGTARAYQNIESRLIADSCGDLLKGG